MARQLQDRAVEAQACYSLGNTYTLLQDYERAIDYHLKHLIIAQDLNDRYTHTHTHPAAGLQESHRQTPHQSPGPQCVCVCVCVCCRIGEGRACWSLGNAHTALGNHDQAMRAEEHTSERQSR